MTKAIEIQSELDKTQSRIAELEMELERQTVAVAATEKAFIDGTADAAKLNDAQGKLSLFERTIESLKSTFEKLKSAFEKQSAQEGRAGLIQQMTAAANDVEPLLNDYLQTRIEFNDVVSKYAETLINKANAYQTKQAQFQSINAELKPPASNSEIQIGDTARRLASATYFNHAPLEYGEVISRAENQLAAKINKVERAKRQAEYNARTMERQTRI